MALEGSEDGTRWHPAVTTAGPPVWSGIAWLRNGVRVDLAPPRPRALRPRLTRGEGSVGTRSVGRPLTARRSRRRVPPAGLSSGPAPGGRGPQEV